MSLILKTRFCGNVFIIQCAGRIMAGHDCLILETALNEAQHEFALFVLNLSEVTRVDSMGLGLLVRLASHLQKRGGAIRLAAPQPFVTHLLGITNLCHFFPCYPTEEAAIGSFGEHCPPVLAEKGSGLKVMVFDPSPDLCAFIRSVLAPHGFDVKTISSFRDAKILLRADQVDCILVGPGSSQLSSQNACRELSDISPEATALQLGAEFKSRDAADATHMLLQMFGINSASHLNEAST